MNSVPDYSHSSVSPSISVFGRSPAAKQRRRSRRVVSLVLAMVSAAAALILPSPEPALASTTFPCTVETSDGYAAGVAYYSDFISSTSTLALRRSSRDHSTSNWSLETVQTYSVPSGHNANGLMMDDVGTIYVHMGPDGSGGTWTRYRLNPDGSKTQVASATLPNNVNSAAQAGTGAYLGGRNGNGGTFFISSSASSLSNNTTWIDNSHPTHKDWTVVPAGVGGALANYVGWVVGLSSTGVYALTNAEGNSFADRMATLYSPIPSNTGEDFGSAYTIGSDIYFARNDGDLYKTTSTGGLALEQVGAAPTSTDIDAAACTGVADLTPVNVTYTVSFNAGSGTGAPADITCTPGTNVTIPATTPTRTGYTFTGWSYTYSGVQNLAVVGDAVPCENMTLTAQYELEASTPWECTYETSDGYTGGAVYYLSHWTSGSTVYASIKKGVREVSTGPFVFTTVAQAQMANSGYMYNGLSLDAAGNMYVLSGFAWTSTVYSWSRLNLLPDGSRVVIVNMDNSVAQGFNVGGHDGTRFVGGLNGDGSNYYSTADVTVSGKNVGAISSTQPDIFDWTVVPSGAAGVLANYAGWMVGLSSNGTLVLVNAATNQVAQESVSLPISAPGGFGAALTLGTDVYFVSSSGDMLVYDSTGALSVEQTGLTGQVHSSFDDIDAAACTGVVGLEAASTNSTIAFDPNQGTGDPADLVCTTDATVTLSTTEPTRTGYTFTGWNTALDGTGTAYAAGSNATCGDMTLYAQWAQNTGTISYDPNGGTGDPGDLVCNEGDTVTLSSVEPARTGYTFAGWNTAIDGSGTSYAAGSTATCADLTLYAQWTEDAATTYTVAYDPNGGTGDPADQTCESGTLTLSSTQPTRAGYAFLGWNTATDGTGTAYAPGGTVDCANLTLYANWVQDPPPGMTVTYDANGGSGAPAAQPCTAGSTVVVPDTAPTRTGYTFAGWNSAADGSGATYLVNQAVLCNDITIYALWTETAPVTYTIAYDPNGGTGDPADQTCTSGVQTLSTTQPTRTGYTFLGWNTSPSNTGTTYAPGASINCENITLYASWSQDPTDALTVTYDPNGGTGGPAPQTCTAGSTVIVPSTTPTRAGFTFNGWNSASDGTGTGYIAGQALLCAEATIYATWLEDSASTYTIAYDPNGGTGDPADQTCTSGVQTLSTTQPTRTGYTFLGWNTSPSSTGAAYAAGAEINCQNVTLYAVWSQDSTGSLTVTYDPNGGTGGPTPQTCTAGSTVIVPATSPTRTGYTFNGWNSVADGTGTAYVAGQALLCADATIYATWLEDSASTYTIAYDPNGGVGDPADQTCVSGVQTLSATVPTRTGYTFLGWNTSPSNTGTTYAPGANINCQNITLYASWAEDPENTLTVAYDANGGSGAPSPQSCTAGSTVVVPQTVPTRPGFTFAGWNSAADGTGSSYIAGQALLCNDTTVYATWTEAAASTYTTTYDPNGGTGDPADQTCVSGVQTLSTTQPTRAGYTFLGWNTAADGTGAAHAPGATVDCQNMSLYAQWLEDSENLLTVTYNPNGGTGGPAPQPCSSGSTVVVPSTIPTRDGYTFNSWNSATDGTGTAYYAGQALLCADAAIYATWTEATPTVYTVTYAPNGGTGDPADQTCTSGNITLSTTVPTRTGYTFMGWNTSLMGSGTPYAAGSTTSCRDLVLYAQWSQNTVVSPVAFDANGGTGDPADTTCNAGSNYVLPTTTPTRAGYTFLGWNTASNGSGVSAAPGSNFQCPPNAVTFYAQWTPEQSVFDYNNNGGNGGPTDQTCVTGSTVVVSSSEPSRTGFTFAGWNSAADGSGTAYIPGSAILCGDTTIYAQWTETAPENVVVAYEPQGGSPDPADLPCVAGTTFAAASAPTRAGYTFLGWNTAADGTGTPVAAGATTTCTAMTLYAMWDSDPTKVVYQPNGGVGDPADQVCAAGSTVVISTQKPSRTGYTFDGWNTAADGSGVAYISGSAIVCGDLVLYATWSPEEAVADPVVSYNTQGGTQAPADQTCTNGSTVTVAGAPSKTGSSFLGWNTAPDGSGAPIAAGSTMACTAVTLYAQWSTTPSVLAYNANNGVGDPADQACAAGSTVVVSNTKPTRAGYSFAGWNTAADGSGTAVLAGSAIVCNSQTLYAQWVEETVSSLTVAYDPHGGSPDPADQSCVAGSTVTVAGAPSKTGHTFTGWNTAADGSGTPVAAGATMGCTDVTLHAMWTPTAVPVNFYFSPGTDGPAALTCAPGQTFVVPSTVPARDGYTFLGWNTAIDGSGMAHAAGAAAVCSQTTLYAQWTQNEQPVDNVVSYDPQGGSPDPSDQPCAAGTTVVVSTIVPARTGYTFTGWNSAADGSGTGYLSGQAKICSSETLYAQWTQDVASTSTVSYNPQGGSPDPADQTCAAGETFTVGAAPTRSGYTFLGWNTLSSGSGTMYAAGATAPCADLALYAVWNANTAVTNATISYLGNGGTGVPPATTCTSGSTYTIPTTTPARSGYTFLGWNTASNGTGTTYAPGSAAVCSSQTLYALWDSPTVSLVYDANGGTNAPATATGTPSSTAVVTSAVPARDGYQFLGWNTACDGTGASYAAGSAYLMPASGSASLCAQWSQVTLPATPSNTVGLAFVGNGGTGVPSAVSSAPSAVITLPSTTPTRNGYAFLGWGTQCDSSGVMYAPGSRFTMPVSGTTSLCALWSYGGAGTLDPPILNATPSFPTNLANTGGSLVNMVRALLLTLSASLLFFGFGMRRREDEVLLRNAGMQQ